MAKTSLPPGYQVPICVPLTRRVMLAGVPAPVLFFVGWLTFVLAGLKLWVLIPGVSLVFLAFWALYRADEWGAALAVELVRASIRRDVRLEP